jgi:hypothetical protein
MASGAHIWFRPGGVVDSMQQPVTNNIKSAESGVVDDPLAATGNGRGARYSKPC